MMWMLDGELKKGDEGDDDDGATDDDDDDGSWLPDGVTRELADAAAFPSVVTATALTFVIVIIIVLVITSVAGLLLSLSSL